MSSEAFMNVPVILENKVITGKKMQANVMEIVKIVCVLISRPESIRNGIAKMGTIKGTTKKLLKIDVPKYTISAMMTYFQMFSRTIWIAPFMASVAFRFSAMTPV